VKNRSPEFDAYIEEAAAFAKPILTKLRGLFHQACPNIEETMKWSFPHFEYRGIVGSMAAFKAHVSFGFWKAKLLSDPHQLLDGKDSTSMATLKIKDVKDLPSDKIILDYIREAVKLNEEGVKLPAKPKGAKKELVVPDDLTAALKKNKKAQAAFDAFSYSHQKEYVEWITEAKRPETRATRVATTIEWLTEGKSRNWKYANC